MKRLEIPQKLVYGKYVHTKKFKFTELTCLKEMQDAQDRKWFLLTCFIHCDNIRAQILENVVF